VREKLDTLTDQLYSKLSAGGTLQNTFKDGVNRRSIKVTKKWEKRGELSDKEKIKYPSVTYYLYRYDKTQGIGSASLYATGVISAKKFEDNDGNASYEFKDLLIYSPAGHEYGYYVTEKSISGYSISYTDENGLADPDLTSNSQCDIVSTPTDAFDDNAKHVTEVSSTNTYDKPENVNISGTKYWNDYGNSPLIYGHRPESIKVTLKRRTNNESGQNNQIDSEDIVLIEKTSVDENETKPYIVWEKSSDGNSDVWRYTIYNLERYAPNGMPYIYSVIEDPVRGYVQKIQTVEINSNDAASNKTMAQLTNSFEGSYYVRKNWLDGNNKYGLRPSSVTIVLQRSIKGKNEWKNIGWDGNCKLLPSETTATATDADGEEKNMPVVSVKLTSANAMKNTGGNSWEYTFKNLPKYADVAGTEEYEYRCVETAIGSAEFKTYTDDDEQAGAYTRTYTAMDENRTVVQNQLKSTSLYVEKEWLDDNEDMYHTRPDTLNFVLQMKGIKPDEKTDDADEVSNNEEGSGTLTDWQDVKINGERYTFTLTRKDNWQTLLQDLPVATVDESDGKTYYALYFRAVEIHSDDGDGRTGTIVSGAADYEDVTKYDEKDQYYNSENNRNEIKISNKLRVDDKSSAIKVTKVWHKNSEHEETAEFELLYRRKSQDNSVGWHCMGDADTDVTGTENGCRDEHSTDAGCVLKEIKSTDKIQTFTWDKLPKYDREGNELEYKVVEHTPDGYVTDVKAITSEGAAYATDYTFTNIELQDYTVKKIWQNTNYAEKDSDGSYTATFKLQRKIEGLENEWTDVTSEDSTSGDDTENKYVKTLTSDKSCDTQSYTWENLPMYTVDGDKYIYRTVETKINGKDVSSDTNGSYIVSYQYANSDDDGEDSPALKSEPDFADKMTVATNRMVYGFVNLSKAAAYIAAGVVTADKSGEADESDKKLADVEFAIYPGVYGPDTTFAPYVTGVTTDKNGNLINSNGKYGNEGKYLIAGTYTLVETQTNPAYSKWGKGVTFTVGVRTDALNPNSGYTGEHGTAWIYTTKLNSSISLGVNYLSEGEVSHSYEDTCIPKTNKDSAYNLESRGVISFTKTGENDNLVLDAHDGAEGESKAYFGVYTDKNCENQVAGMAAADSDNPSKMVLTDKTQDGSVGYTEFSEITNNADIPYLRKASDGQLTLLSGEYYIKELTAPAGYRLDNVVRKAVIAKIDTTDMDSALTDVYANNVAVISVADSDTAGVKDYMWNNTPNKVVIYKKDQYGRTVDLGENGYLELSSNDEKVTFLTGENKIRLYQNAKTPATKSDGTVFKTDKTPNITYDETNGCWIITGLFDSDKSYTLSEPNDSVPANNVQAKSVTFTINTDGSMTVISPDKETKSKGNPLLVTGDDYINYYHSTAPENVLVLRDVSRFRKNVILKKVDSVSNDTIRYISFKLYKYDSKDVDGAVQGEVSVLKDDSFVTTDESGQIDLSKQDEKLINQITGMPVKYGLDIGKYYFEEIERGASDGYRLAGKIFFEIKANDNQASTTEDYEDYAVIEYEENLAVTQEEDGITATVKNTPVDKTRTLNLSKVASDDSSQNLGGARFTLEYVSINDKQPGQHNNITYNCVTDSDGILYVADKNWNIGGQKIQPDISGKGSYTLKEVQAPDNYMTRTESGTSDPVTMLTFKVNSDNEITEVETYTGSEDIVTATIENSDDSNEKDVLKVEVKNEKTVVYVDKRTDIESGKKTCSQKSLGGEKLSGAKLSIYEGVYSGNDAQTKQLVSWDSLDKVHELTPGTLKENTVYTLHEENAPVGYLKADDIYFAVFGTRDKNNEVVSQLYVWTGSAAQAPKSLDSLGTWTEDANWSQKTSLSDNILTMVDEAVIAPVNLKKVVGTADKNEVLSGARFKVESLDSDSGTSGSAGSSGVELGTAVTDKDGKLVWENITDDGFATGYIFDAAGNRLTSSSSKDSFNNKAIILQQNTSGYRVTEIEAPDIAYNEGKSFPFNITDDDYKKYRTISPNGTVSYDVKQYVNITGDDANLVNPAFSAVFELYKYDAENSEITAEHNNYEKIGLEGVEFTLYKKDSSGVYKQFSTYTTVENGLLKIDITEKGEYRLRETNPLTGYTKNSKEMDFTIVNGDYQKILTYDESTDNENHTKEITSKDGDADSEAVFDLPNSREHGTVTLIKKDTDSGKQLSGVKYKLTRTVPESPNTNVDKWFPSTDVTSLTVETGKTYSCVASASGEDDFNKAISDSGKDKEGYLIVKDLQWGTYILVEQEEIDGYIIDAKTFTFTIDADNLNVNVVDDKNDHVTNTKNQLTVKKTDLDGKGLKDAEFELHAVTENGGKKTMNNEVTSFYTAIKDETPNGKKIIAGETTVYGLKKGTYILREIKAPDGYELTNDVIFIMNDNGIVSYVSTCKVDATTGVVTDDVISKNMVTLTNEGSGLSVRNILAVKDTPIEASLVKRLKLPGNSKYANATDKELGDAEYSIRPVSGGRFADGTIEAKTFTGNEIQSDLKAVLVGGCSYTITEIKAPAGYETPETSAEIAVSTSGVVTVTAGKDFLTAYNSDGVANLTFTDVPIEIDLSKIDSETGDKIDEATLGYAEFSIKGKFVNEDVSSVGDDVTTIENLTTKDFKTKLHGRLIADEIYEVTETSAPNGYKLTDTFYIRIDEHGSIIKRGTSKDNLTAVDPATDTLVVKDDPTELIIKKVDDNGLLAGAKFKLTAESSEVTTAFVNMYESTKPNDESAKVTTWTENTIEWTSTDYRAGFSIKNHLIAEVSYKLHEERVPGHEVMHDDIVFHIEPSGKVIIDTNQVIPNNNNMEAAVIDRDNIIMTVQNPIIKGTVTLKKYWKASKSDSDIYEDQYLLPGAVYTLTMVKNCNGKDVSTKVSAEVETEGTYAYASSSTGQNTTDRFTTDGNGQIQITGLPEGKYEFLEVDAPKAYHINNSESDKIAFAISNGTKASVSLPESLGESDKSKLMDTRVNASISLVKYNTESGNNKPLNGVVFDVAYSDKDNPSDDDYTSVGTMTTNADGSASISTGTYPGETSLEGLRRGHYRLTEMNAEDQMLNMSDGTRNTITFEIGNEVNKEYVVNASLQQYLKDQNLYGVLISNTGLISLTEDGILDTPIPVKSVTVTKKWIDDEGADETFRPDSVYVQLYRTYNDDAGKEIKEPVESGNVTLSYNSDDPSTSWKHTWTNLPAYVNINTGSDKYETRLYTYTVEEVNVPVGYKVTYENVTKPSGNIESKVQDGDTTSAITNTLIATKELRIDKVLGGGSSEDEFKVRVKLTKNGNPVSNNSSNGDGYYIDEYLLYDRDTEPSKSIKPDADGWMTIKGGQHIVINIPKGISYEVEEQTDSGQDTVTGNSSKLIYTPRYIDNNGEIGAENVTATIRNAVNKCLDLKKLDDKGNPLAGAEFRIVYTPLEGGSFVDDSTSIIYYKTGEDGKLRLQSSESQNEVQPDLTKQGTYKIYETAAPDGYMVPLKSDGSPILLATITVDAEDKMKVESNYADIVTPSLEKHDSQAKITVVNKPIQIDIEKADQASGKAVSGAVLKLSKLNNDGSWVPVSETGVSDSSYTWVTSDNKVSFKGAEITDGIYKLEEESAPYGYNSVAAPLIFEVDQAGRITETSLADSDGNYNLGKIDVAKLYNYKITNSADDKIGSINIQVIDAKYSTLQITKKGSDGSKLNGVELKLSPKDSASSWEEKTVTTDNDGIASFDALPDGEYTLEELKTAEGYNLLSEKLTISINRNTETYTVKDPSGKDLEYVLVRDKDVLQMTVTNRKGSVLPKTGKTTPRLPKAVLPVVAFIEGLMLYIYGSRGRRRRKKGGEEKL